MSKDRKKRRANRRSRPNRPNRPEPIWPAPIDASPEDIARVLMLTPFDTTEEDAPFPES